DWGDAAAAPVHAAARGYARLAELAARHSGRCDPDVACSAGLLAPLGWLAVCALDPAQAGRCLADPEYAADAAATERKHSGLTPPETARRLSRRWLLPHWLATITGSLALPVEHALALGADPGLFPVVQLAVLLSQETRTPQTESADGPAGGVRLPRL